MKTYFKALRFPLTSTVFIVSHTKAEATMRVFKGTNKDIIKPTSERERESNNNKQKTHEIK